MNVLNACKDNCKFKGGKSGREGQGGIKPDFFGGGVGERRGESRLGRLMGIREREKKKNKLNLTSSSISILFVLKTAVAFRIPVDWEKSYRK